MAEVLVSVLRSSRPRPGLDMRSKHSATQTAARRLRCTLECLKVHDLSRESFRVLVESFRVVLNIKNDLKRSDVSVARVTHPQFLRNVSRLIT